MRHKQPQQLTGRSHFYASVEPLYTMDDGEHSLKLEYIVNLTLRYYASTSMGVDKH